MGANNHPTTVPNGAETEYKNPEAGDKFEDLALDIVKRTHFETDIVDATNVEVYVDVESFGMDALAGMDAVCAIAYDHGFVPVGIIEEGAARFRPRDDDEVLSSID